MESVSCQLQDMYKESICQSNTGKKSISTLDSRLTRLEEHMHKIVDILHELAPAPKTLASDEERTRSGRTVSLSDVEFAGANTMNMLSLFLLLAVLRFLLLVFENLKCLNIFYLFVVVANIMLVWSCI